MGKSFECFVCRYKTPRKSSYDKHLRTKKHNDNMNLVDINQHSKKSPGIENVTFRTEKIQNGTQMDPNDVWKKDQNDLVCRYCNKKLQYKKTLRKHEKQCKVKGFYEKTVIMENTQNDLCKKLEMQQLILQKKEEELEKKEEELEKLREEHIDYMKLLKQIAESSTKDQKVVNMYYIMNNFKEAYNYEDLMKPGLTDNEEDSLSKLEPLAGSIMVIKNRCIEGIDVKKRPIHCLDTARDKYLLRTENKWVVDHKAKKIFAGVSPLIYKHYLLDPQDKKYTIDQIIKNQQLLLNMESKPSQQKLLKDLNDKVYIKNIKLDTIDK